MEFGASVSLGPWSMVRMHCRRPPPESLALELERTRQPGPHRFWICDAYSWPSRTRLCSASFSTGGAVVFTVELELKIVMDMESVLQYGGNVPNAGAVVTLSVSRHRSRAFFLPHAAPSAREADGRRRRRRGERKL